MERNVVKQKSLPPLWNSSPSRRWAGPCELHVDDGYDTSDEEEEYVVVFREQVMKLSQSCRSYTYFSSWVPLLLNGGSTKL